MKMGLLEWNRMIPNATCEELKGTTGPPTDIRVGDGECMKPATSFVSAFRPN